MRRTWRAFGRTILLYSRLSVLAFTISISSASYLPTAVVLFLSFLLITPVFFQRERQCERLVYSTEDWDQRRGVFLFLFFFKCIFLDDFRSAKVIARSRHKYRGFFFYMSLIKINKINGIWIKILNLIDCFLHYYDF